MFSLEYRTYVVVKAVTSLGEENFYPREVIEAMLESNEVFEAVMGDEYTAPCKPLRQYHREAKQVGGRL